MRSSSPAKMEKTLAPMDEIEAVRSSDAEQEEEPALK
jgi:hypothetical protein